MIRRLFNRFTDWFFWAGDPNDVFGEPEPPRRCPCFLHYQPARTWWHLTCACECDHEAA